MELNRIGHGRLADSFGKLYGVSELGAVPTIAPELMPVCSIWERPEFWALLGGRLVSGRFVQPAGGAGNVGFGEIVNAVQGEKHVLCIIDRLLIGSAILIEWAASLGISSGGTPVVQTLRDQRFSESGVGSGSMTATTGIVVDFVLSGGAMLGPAVIPLDIILPPGARFTLKGPVNVAMGVTVEWRERSCTEEELRLR